MEKGLLKEGSKLSNRIIEMHKKLYVILVLVNYMLKIMACARRGLHYHGIDACNNQALYYSFDSSFFLNFSSNNLAKLNMPNMCLCPALTSAHLNLGIASWILQARITSEERRP